ncbi:TPA: hypothetical protein K8M95_001068 [Clostridium perfringens]|uniref:hypothetical protein n=1 Tax=Clostridium perfringens TaxID=1502 RepID=UPI001CB5FC4E|nr:hypothetical protein [Clostridium perfringens]MDK0658209.1 hypothetical protein [Clostridium perfringens]MDM0661880.1 hypothetical protein [Clostridium perfringens]HBI6221961.1 hypothetical protein [Clostridium perfringens]HBI7059946.1 hypothetical protein [Clostridium perfringens]HBI7063931.1 hypothetical protein [Clostridium perfringens]
MLSTKVHKIADFLSLILVLGLSIITITYLLLDLGLIGKLLTLVLISVAIRISNFYFLQKIKIWLKPKKVKEQIKTRVKTEPTPTLDLQQQYITDLKLQASQLFKVAMQSKKLTRVDILGIRDYLKNNVNDPTLKNKQVKNEAHFIYSYLKSEYINEDTLNCVIRNIFFLVNKKAA